MMAFMPWSDKFVTGLDQIDEQHHWLVDQTNRLYDEINRAEPDREVVHHILEGLVSYTFDHFVTEEDLFIRYDYPQTKEHKEEHDAFAKLAVDLLQRHEEGGDVGHETMDLLKEWLNHHILVVDMAYVPFLKGREVD